MILNIFSDHFPLTVEVAILVRLIRSLLPHSHVPCLCVLKLLASLRNLPFSLQELILQWTVLVFDYIDDITPLRKVYDAVFYFLQYDNLRATVCQLLCYLTAPSHVTKWRTQRLLELQKQIAVAEPSLVALLDIYQLHCPDLVTTSHPQRKVHVPLFSHSLWYQQRLPNSCAFKHSRHLLQQTLLEYRLLK